MYSVSVIRELVYSRPVFVGVSHLPELHLHRQRQMLVKNEIDNSKAATISGTPATRCTFIRTSFRTYVGCASTEAVFVVEPTTSFRDLFHFCNKANRCSESRCIQLFEITTAYLQPLFGLKDTQNTMRTYSLFKFEIHGRSKVRRNVLLLNLLVVENQTS